MRLSPKKNPLVFTNVVTYFHEVITEEEPTGIHKRCHKFPRGYHQGRTHWYSQTLSPISMRLSQRKNQLVFTYVVTNFHEVITKEEPTGIHKRCHQISTRLSPRKNPLVFTNVVTNFHEVIIKEEPTGNHKRCHQFP